MSIEFIAVAVFVTECQSYILDWSACVLGLLRVVSAINFI